MHGQPVLNIKNTDNKCFVWCILSKLTNIISDRVTDYPQNYHDFLNLRNITFPVAIKDINTFERNNPDISINVFGYDTNKKSIIGPYYHTKCRKTNHVNLMYLSKIRSSSAGHYCLIRNLSPLCKSVHKNAKYVCDNCLTQFRNRTKFTNHVHYCKQVEHSVKIDLPKEKYLKFKKFSKHNKTRICYIC